MEKKIPHLIHQILELKTKRISPSYLKIPTNRFPNYSSVLLTYFLIKKKKKHLLQWTNHPRLLQNNKIKQKIKKLHNLKGKKIKTPTPTHPVYGSDQENKLSEKLKFIKPVT